MGINDGSAGIVQTSACISPIDVYQATTNRTASEPEHSDELKSEETVIGQRPRQRRPDRAVYVPRGRRSQTTPPTTVVNSITKQPQSQQQQEETIDQHFDLPSSLQSTTWNVDDSFIDSSSNSLAEPMDDYCDALSQTSNNNCVNEIEIEQHQEQQQHQSVETLVDNSSSDGCDNSDDNIHSNETIQSVQRHIIDDTMSKFRATEANKTGAATANDKDYNEEKELQRTSKEITRRNRRIIKQTNSDILEINDAIPMTQPAATMANETDPPKSTTKLPSKSVSNSKASGHASIAETSSSTAPANESDDWETLFDENGECLDPKIIDEITASVGKVTITKPKSDYKTYQSQAPPINLDLEEFPHVLEISNFPVEFKTQDLMMLFSQYKDTGFDIKWVDDTHALAVFSSSKVAAQALNMGHPFVKLKPLTQATVESRARAKKSAAHLQPYRQRPETCAALARRLVTGALGVRLSTAREELENERRVLREAKERKLLAAKQSKEAWDNNN